VCFVALTAPSQGKDPQSERLFGHNLKLKKDRVTHLVHLIRLCGIMAWMGEQLKTRDRPEFEVFERYVPSSPWSISDTRHLGQGGGRGPDDHWW
jgi:hypothetical protein